MATSQGLKALVVDDDFVVRHVHKRMLRPYGFQVAEAENGQSAVDYFSEGNAVHLVLMDKEMPVMDGVQAVKALKQKGVSAKIVGITTDEHAKEAFAGAGADAFVVKPLNGAKIENLLKTVNLLN